MPAAVLPTPDPDKKRRSFAQAVDRLRRFGAGVKDRLKRFASAKVGVDVTKRLPLHEVLLEEYETHYPPGAAGGAQAGGAAQTRISAEAMKELAGSEAPREEGDEIKDEAARKRKEEEEKEEDAKLASAFFTLLVKTQKEEAKRQFNSLHDEYYKELGGDADIAERAAVDHIFGILGDEYERQKRERERPGAEGVGEEEADRPQQEEEKPAAGLKEGEAEQTPVAQEEERKEAVREKLKREAAEHEKWLRAEALDAWRKSRGKRPAPPDRRAGGPTGRGSIGGGGGSSSGGGTGAGGGGSTGGGISGGGSSSGGSGGGGSTGGSVGGSTVGGMSGGGGGPTGGGGGASGGGGGASGGAFSSSGGGGPDDGAAGNGSGNGGPAGGGVGGRIRTPREAKQARARAMRSALCLSGGGIRSATFNLGILQGLARHGLLEQFDYLSTVSGGGFIGSWLTAWIHRQRDPLLRAPVPPEDEDLPPEEVSDTRRVVAQLKCKPKSPLEPEPDPINNLRVFSNYLSPQLGLLSADTWTLISTLLRNLLLTWLVFIPFLLAALMLPRMWMTFVTHRTFGDEVALPWSFAIGLAAGWLALIYVGLELSRPKRENPYCDPYRNREAPFLLCCLLPGLVSAASLAVFLRRLSERLAGRFDGDGSWAIFFGFAVLLFIIPWLVILPHRLRRRAGAPSLPRKGIRWRLALITVVIILAQVVTGAILYAVVTKLYLPIEAYHRIYAAFSVPLLLAVLSLDCALIAGFTSTLTEDDTMEWWARAGAWFLIAIVGWAAVHVLVLFGPDIFLLLGRTLGQARVQGFWSVEGLKAVGKVLTIVGGIVSGVITLTGGFSAKTPAHGAEEEGGAGVGGKLFGALTSLLAPLFLAFLIILMALGTNWLLTPDLAAWLNGLRWPGWLPSLGLHTLLCWLWPGCWLYFLEGHVLPWWLRSDLTNFLNVSPADHAGLLYYTPLPFLLLVCALVALVGFVMGLLINSNKFSLHYMWRNRIIRAYLGASHGARRKPQPFTNFDDDDDIQMHELRPQPQNGQEVIQPLPAYGEEGAALQAEGDAPQGWSPARPRKLFHVLNLALNLAGGDKLAWQDRQAESFTVSPLHCGSYWLGYRRSSVYGGERGISLGTAVAISGAFVSPNMGYMMTSPVVRFLMTLFNVRFGWWLGNPGRAGDETYLIERLIGFLRSPLGRKIGKPFESESPALSVRPIVTEAFGKTDDGSPYVYLSDGGHFENLGLYEMVLRRCRFIVVSDASTDAGYSFDSLAQSIRQIRVDHGVAIEITDMSIIPPSDDLRGKYCAVGKIRYSCMDRRADDPAHAGLKDEDFDGTLVYIKASMIGDEPRDVVNYGRGSRTFPQEIIVDQWFSEAQFESYRALGSHIIDALCSTGLGHIRDQNQLDLAAFEEKARLHNRLNFGVFKERISYDALINEFRRIMRKGTPPEYEARVREYFERLVS